MISLYTDGSSRGNPGLGGCAAILRYGPYTKELVEAYEKTTNNRMELSAVILGLKAIRKNRQEITVYTDSRYVVDTINKGWLRSWLKKNFKGKKNKDLWLDFWHLYQKHIVKMTWIEGHSGHKENERCDFLAVQAAKSGPWKKDYGYIQKYSLENPVQKELIS